VLFARDEFEISLGSVRLHVCQIVVPDGFRPLTLADDMRDVDDARIQ
jgi:hypothetical protein